MRRADGFVLSLQNRTAAWLCNWLKLFRSQPFAKPLVMCSCGVLIDVAAMKN